MVEFSNIAWCTHTHNTWEGCTKVGPGCDHCYAEARNKRFHAGGNWGPGAPRRLTSIQNRNCPLRWQRERRAAIDAGLNPEPVRVFAGSLMDPFDNEAPAGGREHLWSTIEACPDLDWILVTKRIGNVAKMAPICGFGANVIVIATIVNQPEADRDMGKLCALKVRRIARRIGVSYEPALGPVNWHVCRIGASGRDLGISAVHDQFDPLIRSAPWQLDWLIIGGESAQGGAKAREFHLAWAARTIDQCLAAHVPVFMKQMGSNAHSSDGPLALRDRAGANPDEWPGGYRIRQFPTIGRTA